jgi:hypothetical protein
MARLEPGNGREWNCALGEGSVEEHLSVLDTSRYGNARGRFSPYIFFRIRIDQLSGRQAREEQEVR